MIRLNGADSERRNTGILDRHATLFLLIADRLNLIFVQFCSPCTDNQDKVSDDLSPAIGFFVHTANEADNTPSPRDLPFRGNLQTWFYRLSHWYTSMPSARTRAPRRAARELRELQSTLKQTSDKLTKVIQTVSSQQRTAHFL